MYLRVCTRCGPYIWQMLSPRINLPPCTTCTLQLYEAGDKSRWAFPAQPSATTTTQKVIFLHNKRREQKRGLKVELATFWCKWKLHLSSKIVVWVVVRRHFFRVVVVVVVVTHVYTLPTTFVPSLIQQCSASPLGTSRSPRARRIQ